ncbi:hypothetical protein [Terriglobus aquaticus]|uniref:Uncharacterized protein n=1 Tax=Terriglobus aquaticus TaxID=940139 RepID=A0ABW9KGM7_9BACT|nr:hypothetical protein [Terriglobus aquaticus]
MPLSELDIKAMEQRLEDVEREEFAGENLKEALTLLREDVLKIAKALQEKDFRQTVQGVEL